MPINDQLGDKKNEFIEDVQNFVSFIDHKYASSENKQDYALILSAMVDTHHELTEKRHQVLNLLAGNNKMRFLCTEALTQNPQFLLPLIEIIAQWPEK